MMGTLSMIYLKEMENINYYIGQFKNNLKNGKGILYYKSGNIKYEGGRLD